MSLFPLLSEMEIRDGGDERLWEESLLTKLPVWGSRVGERGWAGERR